MLPRGLETTHQTRKKYKKASPTEKKMKIFRVAAAHARLRSPGPKKNKKPLTETKNAKELS
jgi:hypothetical protein